MDNGIYIALSRELGLFRDMDATANNIANANTAGYNAEHMLFRSYLVKDDPRPRMAFAHDIATFRRTDMGSLRTTGNALDIAIAGPGYFVVETPLGERYTRAGNFQVDGRGVLITPDGYPVLDTAGQRIIFNEDDHDISIGEAGNLKVNGEDRAIIGVVEFGNEQLMERLSSSLFKTDEIPTLTETSRVVQGVLEESNVQPVIELTHMMAISREVSNTAKFIETMYDLQRKASNTLARQS